MKKKSTTQRTKKDTQAARTGAGRARRKAETHRLRNRVKRLAFERMVKIHGWLQDGMYPNCTSIARDLEVSLKTASRDVDFMRDSWNLPIGYDDQRHGFYFTQPVDRLPWVPVTEAELFAVCVSQKVLEMYQGMPFQKPLALAFERMTRVLDDQERYTLENLDLAFSFRPFAPEDADLRLLELLTRTVAERRGLKFQYRKPGERQADVRHVHPYHLMEFESRLYLLAHDLARNAIRTFVLGRMKDAVVTDERFERPQDFDPKKQFDTSLGVMSGQGDYQVVIEMDAWLADVLRGRRWHPSQVWTDLPAGGSLLQLRLSCLEEIERHVLSWGTHATILGPPELIGRVAMTARILAHRYAAGDGHKAEGKE